MKYDVIVIGAGLASLMAAAKAVDRDKKVLLVASGMGSVSLSTGCIDVLGCTKDQLHRVSNPWEYLPKMVITNGQHPYSKTGLPTLQEGLAFFCNVCNRWDYPYVKKTTPSGDVNYLLPSSGGTLKSTYLVPETMSGGDLDNGGEVLILGVKGLRDFNSQYIADKLNSHISHKTSFVNYHSAEIDMGFKHTRVISPYDIALLMEEKDFRVEFSSKVKATGKEYSRIGVPGVLGVTKWREVRDDLSARLGGDIFEIPTMPPSVPGIRLYNLLMKHLKESGVQTILGYPLRLGNVSGKRCISLELLSPGRNQVLYGDTFILGTGGILGGGIDSDSAKVMKESVFGLPVNQKHSYSEWFDDGSMIQGQHPVDMFGVDVDEKLRPVDIKGTVILENVLVTGRSLSHYAPFAELSGNGVAIATGYEAGLLA